MPLRAQPDGPQYPDLNKMRALAFVYLCAALYVVNDRGGSQFSLVAHIRGAPNAEYSRLTLGLPRHGTCEQMPRLCAVA